MNNDKKSENSFMYKNKKSYWKSHLLKRLM